MGRRETRDDIGSRIEAGDGKAGPRERLRDAKAHRAKTDDRQFLVRSVNRSHCIAFFRPSRTNSIANMMSPKMQRNEDGAGESETNCDCG